MIIIRIIVMLEISNKSCVMAIARSNKMIFNKIVLKYDIVIIFFHIRLYCFVGEGATE